MLSSRVFWKLLAASAGVYLAAAIVLGWVISRWQADELSEHIDGNLRDAAFLVADDLAAEMEDGRSEALQERVRKLAQQTGIRYTLIDKEGEVLADSAQADLAGVATMQSHDDRPEVVRALSRGEGMAEHTSASLGEPYRYFAARAEVDGQTGWRRTGLDAARRRSTRSRRQRSDWCGARRR